MNNYSEYERAFDWNIADLNHNKITIGEYEAKFRKIVDKIRAEAIDEFYNRLIKNKSSMNQANYPWNYVEIVYKEMKGAEQ